jgi:hypothetical protein
MTTDQPDERYNAATRMLYAIAQGLGARGGFDEEEMLAMLAGATAEQAARIRGPVGAIEYVRDLADTLESMILPMDS